MFQSVFPFGRSRACRVLMAVMATLLALQAVSVSVSMARGPSHFHRDSRTSIVLSDFRRDDLRSMAAGEAQAAWSGHHHGIATLLRHHHAATDTSVAWVDADRLSEAAAEDAGLGLDLALAAFVAVVMSTLTWAGPAVSHRRAAHAPWQPLTVVPRRIDRPPQPC